MEIRKANEGDVARLSELFNAYRVFYQKESDPGGARQFMTARVENNDAEIFVSVGNGVITGFVQLYPIFSSTRMKKYWLLNDLFVEEGFRGQGFSIALIEEAKKLCQQSGAAGFMLETAKSNAIGNQLYQKMGMELDTEHNVYNWSMG